MSRHKEKTKLINRKHANKKNKNMVSRAYEPISFNYSHLLFDQLELS